MSDFSISTYQDLFVASYFEIEVPIIVSFLVTNQADSPDPSEYLLSNTIGWFVSLSLCVVVSGDWVFNNLTFKCH